MCLGIGGISSGCEVEFDPLAENEQHYSIAGYLDVEADMQFVRVERLRDSLSFDTKSVEATVSVERVASGETWTWRDSVFDLGPRRRVHNFWSTKRLFPRETYRFSVQGSEARASSATVTLPDTFPDPELISFPPCLRRVMRCERQIRVEVDDTIDKLAAVRADYHYTDAEGGRRECVSTGHVDHLDDARQTDEGLVISFDWWEDLGEFTASGPLVTVDVFVAAGGPGWPEREEAIEIREEELFLPGNRSNVEGGVGFLGGIASKTVNAFPLRSCASSES